MQKPHILIVEDEDVTRFNLRNLFEAEGYQVSESTDGESMDTQLKKNTINLVIMDINLPGKNGLLLARELTSNNDLGLIFLTGRDSDIDKILGLEIGADDYLTKPFNPRELTIRARNILNRIGQTKNETEKAVITFNEWSLDGNSRKMTAPDGQVLAIPRGEYRALRLFKQSSNQTIKQSNDRTIKQSIEQSHNQSNNQTIQTKPVCRFARFLDLPICLCHFGKRDRPKLTARYLR